MALNQYEYNYITGAFSCSNVGKKYNPWGSSTSNYSWSVEFTSVKMSGTGYLAQNPDSDGDNWKVGIDSNRHPFLEWRSPNGRNTYTYSNLTISWNTWFSVKWNIQTNAASPTVRCTLDGTTQDITCTGRWTYNVDKSLTVGSSVTTIRDNVIIKGYPYSNTLATATFALDSMTQGATSVTVDGNTYSCPAIQHYSDPAPTASASFTYTNASAISLTVSANYSCNKWEYKVGSGSWTTFSTSTATSQTTSVTVSSTATVYVRVTKVGSGYTGESSVAVDRSAPTVTISLSSRTSTSLTVAASTNKTCNLWEYSTNNGSSYTQFSTSSGTSATATISGLSNNTSYSVRIRARATNYIQGASSTGSYSTLDASAPVVTISLSSRTSSSLTIAATADTTCNKWEYSINDGSSFTQFSTTSATSVSYTITGLSANTTYNVKIRANKASNNVKGTSARGAYTTLGQALLNSVAEFYADAATAQTTINATIYSSTFTYTLLIKRGNTTLVTYSIGAQSTGTKNITVTLSAAQRTALLNGMSDVASFSATYTLTTYDNGTQVGSVSTATGTIRTSSNTSAPGQPSFNYADVNASTVAVTGDSSKLIAGQSSLRLTNLTATAKNGASIASYSITIGGTTKSSTSGGTVNIGTVSQSGSLSLSVTAKDTRGYTSSKSVTITSYAYAIPSLTSYAVGRNSSVNTQIDISASGTYSNIGNNTVTLKYKYKKVSAGSYGTEVSVTPTRSGSTFSYSASNIATFDEDSSYNFVITIQDGLQTAVYNLVVPSFNPLIAYRPNAIGFGTVPQSTKRVEIAQDWSLVANGKNNAFAYMPYSFGAYGVASTAGYARIATITITGNNCSSPIEFEIQRRWDSRSVKLSVLFNNEGNTDPALSNFYYDSFAGTWASSPPNAFIYKTATSVWDVYVQKSTSGDNIGVSTYLSPHAQDRCTVTYSQSLLTSVPSGAVMATAVPVLSSTPTLTKNSGNSTVSDTHFYRCGNICWFSFLLTLTANVAVGSDPFGGTVSGIPMPLLTSSTMDYTGTSMVTAYLTSNGAIGTRVWNGTAVNTAQFRFNFMYMTNS